MVGRLTSLALVLVGALGVAAAEPLTWVVAPGGDDRNPGTAARPLATLVGAREALRAWRQTRALPEGGATISLRGGTYALDATFALDERDSGTPQAPVTYRAWPGEEVRLMGGRAIPAAAAVPLADDAVRRTIIEPAARDRVLQIDLRRLGITDYGRLQARGFRRPYIPAPLELFVDDQPLHLARWPNQGSVPIGKVLDPGSVPRDGDFSDRGGTFQYTDERHALWQAAPEVWLSGLWHYGFADDTLRVAAIDPVKKTVTLAQATMYGLASGRPWQAYYALNLLPEIDAPGEYVVDRQAGMLTFYPPEGYAPGRSRLCVSLLEGPMVALEGASHVRFEHLLFECSRGMGVYIERGERNRIGGCSFRNLGLLAVCLGKGTEPLPVYTHAGTARPASRALGSWHEHIYDNSTFNREAGTHHQVVGCDIYNTGAGGISLGGGDRRTLTPAGNVVRNCHIHDFNRLDRTYKAAVNIDGVGNRIEHCLIHDCPNNAIYLHGNDHVLEYNEIHRAVQCADDMGAVYLGRDPSEYGNIIRTNYFHDNGSAHGATSVLYFDDSSCGVRVEGNVFSANRGGNWINGGYNHRFENNLFVDDRAAIGEGWAPARWHDYTKEDLLAKRLHGDLDITRPPYAERYPDLLRLYQADPADAAAHGQDVERNVSVRSGSFGTGRNRLQDNWETDADPGFVAAASGDFALRADAPVFRRVPGFKPIPFAQIGLYQDEYRPVLRFEAPNLDGPEQFLLQATVAVARPRGAARVVYTLDGSEPTPQSTLYTVPLVLTRTTLVRARAVGAGEAPSVSAVASREFRAILPTLLRQAQVNFQPADGAAEPGWRSDSGAPFALQAGKVAYGWTHDNREATRRRGKNAEARLDTLVHFSAGTAWQIALGNGTYDLTVCLGDAEYACEDQTLYAQGQEVCKGLNLPANTFRQERARVTVQDNLLTLTSTDAPHGPRLTRMNWLTIEPVP